MMMLHVVAFIAKPPLNTVIPPICRQTLANPQIYEGLPTIPQPAVSGGLTPKLLLWSYQATGHYGNPDHVWKCWSFAWQAWDVNGKDLLEANKTLFKHKHAWIFLILVDRLMKQRKSYAIHQPFARNMQKNINIKTKKKHNKTLKPQPSFSCCFPKWHHRKEANLFFIFLPSRLQVCHKLIQLLNFFIPSHRSKSPSSEPTNISVWRPAKVVSTISKGQKWWVHLKKSKYFSKIRKIWGPSAIYMSHCLPEKMSPYRLASSCFIFSGRLLCSARIVSSISSLGPVAGTSHIETSSSQKYSKMHLLKNPKFSCLSNLKSPGNWWIWAVNLHHLGFHPKVGKIKPDADPWRVEPHRCLCERTSWLEGKASRKTPSIRNRKSVKLICSIILVSWLHKTFFDDYVYQVIA